MCVYLRLSFQAFSEVEGSIEMRIYANANFLYIYIKANILCTDNGGEYVTTKLKLLLNGRLIKVKGCHKLQF